MAPNGIRQLLLAESEPSLARSITAQSARLGWRTIVAPTATDVLNLLASREGRMTDLVIIDGTETPVAPLIAEIRSRRPAMPVLKLIDAANPAQVVSALRAGASDYVFKPMAADRLARALDLAMRSGLGGGELRPLSEKQPLASGFHDMVGTAPKFRSALAVAAKAARAKVPVLIEGEAGVGKHTLAEAIHRASTRADHPMLTIDCQAVPGNLMVSELFGHEAGAFPGAFARQIGKLVEADGGTLYLDNVGHLPVETQQQLVHFLENDELRPLGGRVTNSNVRVIAASDIALLEAVRAGLFREDLYYRLAVVPITLPPLRERSSDIAALARHMLAAFATIRSMAQLAPSPEALSLLAAYPWPGNIRQLHDVLFRVAALNETGSLTPGDFPHIAHHLAGAAQSGSQIEQRLQSEGPIAVYDPDGHIRTLDAIEADLIRLAISHYRGRMTEVARRLGIGRSTLYRKLSELGISDAA